VDQIKKNSLQKLDKQLGPVWSVVTINPNMVTFTFAKNSMYEYIFYIDWD
jgi:hypothetical protein